MAAALSPGYNQEFSHPLSKLERLSAGMGGSVVAFISGSNWGLSPLAVLEVRWELNGPKCACSGRRRM